MKPIALIAVAILLAFSPEMSRADENAASVHAERPEVVVYKSPYCGCCGGWIDHIKAEGYPVTTHNIADLEPIKRKTGIPDTLMSCHTATVAGYVIEGHVPASAIERLLTMRPAIKGLAVPGMPIGSPGMEGPDPEPYDVMSFTDDGETAVFISVPARD